jgi:hypothetical protein
MDVNLVIPRLWSGYCEKVYPQLLHYLLILLHLFLSQKLPKKTVNTTNSGF